MTHYRLARQGQQRLEIPSGDSDAVVQDIQELVGSGTVRRRARDDRQATQYRSALGLITASHHRGGFFTTVMVERPAVIPIPWLALRAYSAVSQEHYDAMVGQVAKPIGLLAVSTIAEDLAAKLPELRDEFPEDFVGVSVESINPVPRQVNRGGSSSRIQVYRPGEAVPQLLEHLAVAAEHLQPGGLGPDPGDALSRQIGWEGYGKFSIAWQGAMSMSVSLAAAQFCMQELGVVGPVDEF